MKIYKLPTLSENDNSKEYCLGCDDLDTNAVYILYGRLARNEPGRVVAPIEGYEAILYLLKGEIRVTKEGSDFTISEGEAFHIKNNENVTLENLRDTESVYILSGGNAPEAK